MPKHLFDRCVKREELAVNMNRSSQPLCKGETSKSGSNQEPFPGPQWCGSPRDRSLPPAAGPASARARLRSAPFPATAAPANPPRVVLPILLHAQHAIQLARTWGYGNRLPGCRTGVRATADAGGVASAGISQSWAPRGRPADTGAPTANLTRCPAGSGLAVDPPGTE